MGAGGGRRIGALREVLFRRRTTDSPSPTTKWSMRRTSDERERFSEALGDGAVGEAGLRNTRRMSVPDHEGGGVVRQRPAHHDARMDGGAVHRSIEDFLVGDGPVVGVEEDRNEDLVTPPVKAGIRGSAGSGPAR